MPTCANCHSFSRDGKTMGMDVDGPDGDKGAYMLAPVASHMVVDRDRILSWNSFPGRPKGTMTLGFLSRVSPDGQTVVSTVNESLYVANFQDYRFVQVFFPTRGILAWYARDTGRIEALPGADDPAFVHTNGVWSPDGKWIVFSRAAAFDPYRPGQEMARYPNDPREPQIQYDLCRIPFAGGKGGEAVPIEGASRNGMSNTFPKVSPDGRWIVFTKCKNGQLLRPDGRLWIVPFEGGTAREMRCNLEVMNSWHTFSPNGRWLAFTSKTNTPFTQLFLTHLDEEGNDTPAVLVPNSTAGNRAVNLPEFLNAAPDAIEDITIPAVGNFRDIQEGSALLEKGEAAAAVPIFEKALTEDPNVSRAHAGLGASLLRLARYPDALAHFRQALSIRERAPMVHVEMAVALDKVGRKDDALVHLARAVELAPRLFTAQKYYGLALLAQSKTDDALVHLEQARTLVPADPEVGWALVHLFLDRQEFAHAFGQLDDIARRNPDDPRAPTLLGYELATCPDAALRDPARAMEYARKACEITHYADVGALRALAAAQASAGHFLDAARTAERALAGAGSKDPRLGAALRDELTRYRDGRALR